MRKGLIALSAGVLIGAMLGGCGMEKVGDLGNKNIRKNAIKYNVFDELLPDKRFADDGMNDRNRVNGRRLNSNNVVGNHKNYRIVMNGQIADKITELEQIKSSYVMLADDNAYVAVSLDEHEPKGNAKMMSRSNLRQFTKNGAAAGKQMSSLSTGESLLTEQLKSQIADAVKEARPQIANIYISANPDFVGRMNAYMNDFMMGYPIQNYIMEFNAMAERLFPAAKPDRTGDGLMKQTSVSRKHRLLE